MDSAILDKAKNWAESEYFDQETRQEVQALLDANNEEEINDRFGASLEFGTGGMRGLMGVGINRMNTYTVRQATEGLARYIAKNQDPNHSGVVIGYDSRNNAFEFAQTASEVLTAHGIKVYLYKSLVPTPQVSFEVIARKAMAGIIITASHNPKEYNGYKVYWKHGGQVVPPDDKAIIAEVRNVATFEEIKSMPLNDALRQNMVVWLGDESDEAYLKAVKPLGLGTPEINKKLGIVYTPLHGTGGRLVPKILKQHDFERISLVPEQAKPDGNFSTLRSPNPEDEKALEMALAMVTDDDDLIMANDPDADRLGVMVRDGQKWVRLNGNQIGVLLLDFHLQAHKESETLPKNPYFIMSLVSTPMAVKIAVENGLSVTETLTGFKWIFAEAIKLQESGEGSFFFGMEESHGFLTGTHTGDKDGIWAAMAFAEMAADCKAKGQSVVQRLNNLYQRYGYFLDDLATKTYPGLQGMEKIKSMLNEYRNNPPANIAGMVLHKVTDLQNQTITRADGTTTGLMSALPPANVIIFELEGGNRVIVRPSGTEPKIKFYFNLQGGTPEELEEKMQAVKAQMLAD